MPTTPVHTDPDETDTELDALDDVFAAVQRSGNGEDDVILLGDLNVDESIPSVGQGFAPPNGRGSWDNFPTSLTRSRA